MHDPDAPVPSTPAPAAVAIPAGPGRRWVRVVVGLLAAIGLLAIVLFALGYYLQAKDARMPKRVVIDETSVIDKVMGETYGKYSDTKKGWLYVGEDNVTYLMRVVQQARIPDGADGDELYFVASGASIGDARDVTYGVFWLRPAHPYDGTLRQASMQARYRSATAVRPEQVRFEALGDNLWGWVIKTQRTNPHEEGGAIITMNTVIAPHGDRIAELGSFLAAREEMPTESCEDAKAAWDSYWRSADENFDDVEGIGPPLRCDKRRWTYRTGLATGSTPVPITVTVGGMLDGQTVEPRSWKLVFDPKRFAYDVPADLKPPRDELGEE